jgi:hypothetical protein
MKTKQAYQIKATIEGKSWETKSTVLTADNEAEARAKAINVLYLKDEHKIDIEPVIVYSSDSKLTSDNYPYGRLKTTAFFSVEYNKKGSRTTFQTICPKSGRTNKEKHSTYYTVILPIKKENNYIDFCGYLDFNGTESINKGIQFMTDFYELFTIEEIKSITISIIGMCQVNTKAMVIYSGSNFEDLKPLINDQIKNLCTIAKTGENLFFNSYFDLSAIEATKKPNYNPFKTVQYSI